MTDDTRSPGALVATFASRRAGFEVALTLAARPGEVVALLGPNGAGKSTALAALAGQLPIERGDIRLGDRVLSTPHHTVPPRQRRVGQVFQDYLLFPHLTVLDNIAFGPRARGASKSQANAIAHDWMRRLGITELGAARASQVSGGQSQRVALARALATDPELLLLDEPFAAADVVSRDELRAAFAPHLRDARHPTVLVTHDPVDARELADRVIIVEAGAVTQSGTWPELVASPASAYVARVVS
jgi:molybdate transport system ATP-binding protein